jgi:hypothetical protein
MRAAEISKADMAFIGDHNQAFPLSAVDAFSHFFSQQCET